MELPMPFEKLTPRSLTPSSIRANAPVASGIYGISNSREWIYIGESDNIQATLLGYLQEGDTSIMKKQPTGFVFEVCGLAGRSGRQDRLVLEYEPTCNRHASRGL
jgi:hypothetical protein